MTVPVTSQAELELGELQTKHCKVQDELVAAQNEIVTLKAELQRARAKAAKKQVPAGLMPEEPPAKAAPVMGVPPPPHQSNGYNIVTNVHVGNGTGTNTTAVASTDLGHAADVDPNVEHLIATAANSLRILADQGIGVRARLRRRARSGWRRCAPCRTHGLPDPDAAAVGDATPAFAQWLSVSLISLEVEGKCRGHAVNVCHVLVTIGTFSGNRSCPTGRAPPHACGRDVELVQTKANLDRRNRWILGLGTCAALTTATIVFLSVFYFPNLPSTTQPSPPPAPPAPNAPLAVGEQLSDGVRFSMSLSNTGTIRRKLLAVNPDAIKNAVLAQLPAGVRRRT